MANTIPTLKMTRQRKISSFCFRQARKLVFQSIREYRSVAEYGSYPLFSIGINKHHSIALILWMLHFKDSFLRFVCSVVDRRVSSGSRHAEFNTKRSSICLNTSLESWLWHHSRKEENKTYLAIENPMVIPITLHSGWGDILDVWLNRLTINALSDDWFSWLDRLNIYKFGRIAMSALPWYMVES